MNFAPPPLAEVITPNVLGIVFAVTAVIFAAVSWVLVYHWDRYGYNPKVIARMRTLYFGGAVAWFAMMVIGTLLYQP